MPVEYEAEKEVPRRGLDRIIGSMPWLRPKDIKRYRVKIFKSGNSLALRLPAALELKPGMEMELRVEDGEHYAFEAVERPKRRFDVDSIWGISPGLVPLTPEERAFDERPSQSDESAPPSHVA